MTKKRNTRFRTVGVVGTAYGAQIAISRGSHGWRLLTIDVGHGALAISAKVAAADVDRLIELLQASAMVRT